MKKSNARLLMLVIASFACLSAFAQSECDNLYKRAEKLQKVMTVASQTQAISFFEKAKYCYESQEKKDSCDLQIQACRDAVDRLANGGSPATYRADGSPCTKLETDSQYIKFKGKGGDFKKVKVDCDSQGWNITESPSWVSCSRNDDNEVVVEIEKNETGKERSGQIIIECGDKSATVVVIQEKYKKFGIL